MAGWVWANKPLATRARFSAVFSGSKPFFSAQTIESPTLLPVLGWSSGAASHLVERQNVGKSAMITFWQLAEASLTPTPAEPRTSAMITKSLPPEATPEAQQRGDVVVIVQSTIRVTE